MKEPKNLREGLELHLQRGLPVMSYDNGYRTEALSKAGILDLLAAYPAEPVPAESADEWARLDAANADEDARERVVAVLREFGHEENDSGNGWVLFADALIAAGLIKGTSDNGPMLSGEELRAASEKVDRWLEDPTPEQALRAHIADLLTDVDHFDGCHTMVEGDGTCTCLVGRIERAIAPESAIGIIARSVTEQMLGDASQEIGDLWESYPEIGEHDWEAVVRLVMWRARSGKPDEATHREAYEHLKGRVEGGAA